MPPKTFAIFDQDLRNSFLVDSGSDISVLPLGIIYPDIRRKVLLTGPTNNSTIKSVGTGTLDLNFKRLFPCSWKFHICPDVRQPILGADFLAHY